MSEAVRWIIFQEAVRGFLFEKHVPADAADEWVNVIAEIARESLVVTEASAEGTR